jgi:DNA-binding NarL/FixJ family response regulator
MSLRRVLIVEDHVVVAEGLVRLLGDCFDVIGIVVDGRVAVDAIVHLRPDVVLLDLTMPKISGLDVLRLVAERGVEPNAIVLTMHADPQLALEALKAGAHGFVMKESSTEELLAAIGVVLNGGTYIASALTKDVLSLMVSAGPAAARPELTSQQREVLRLVVQGQRAKEIAQRLDLTTRSVEMIKYRLMHMLDVHSTAQLVRCAVEHRLVPF